MKANIINDEIKVFGVIPKQWKTYLNFDKAPKELLESEGFFDVEIPTIDQKTQQLGNIFWDSELTMFTYHVIAKTDIDIAYELAMQGWHEPAFAMRIIAPDALLIQAPGIETWARYKGLPVIVENDSVYLYCDFILPVHQSLLAAYQEVISIEMRPEP